MRETTLARARQLSWNWSKTCLTLFTLRPAKSERSNNYPTLSLFVYTGLLTVYTANRIRNVNENVLAIPSVKVYSRWYANATCATLRRSLMRHPLLR